jgi:type IV secretion system protein VirB4
MINLLVEKLLKKPKQDPAKLVAKSPDEDFIPYVCHFDPNTILTKNGELLQIIRVTGFSNNTIASELVSLRDSVRDAITDNVKDNKVAFWFSTIRRRKNITPKGEFKDSFSQKVNETWVNLNKWDDQYVNELYITIITEGFDSSIVNLNAFMRSFSYMSTRLLHKKFLQDAHKKLSVISSEIISDIAEYGAKLLGIKEWEGILYSEPMRFFGKIVNLYEERYPLSANDISNDLASHKLAFGGRELQVIGYKNKNFAAVLSLKEYLEVSTSSLDRILQLPLEFIITQSFDFTFSKKDLTPYEYQNYILQISGDEDFRQLSGIANFIESAGNDQTTDYGKLQTTVMIIGATQERLEKDIKMVLEQFNALGFTLIREDIFMEHCFWSQLPGNFRYLRRQKLINTYRIAGFAALHNFPAGLVLGNKWGSAVTVLKTVLNTPYFFNFHNENSGHTLILGPQNSGKTVLLNFLLAQARKFNNKLFYFDLSGSSKCFIKALGGKYYNIDQEVSGQDLLQLNPFSLIKNHENQNFLNEFFGILLFFAAETEPESEADIKINVPATKTAAKTSAQEDLETEKKFIPQITEQILNSNINDLSAAIEVFNNSQTKNIYQKLKSGQKKLGEVFNCKQEIYWLDQIMAFDLSAISARQEILIMTVNYLLYRVSNLLDLTPAIIVLDEAWSFIDNPIIGPKIKDFLEMATKKNCVVIFTSKNIEASGKSIFSREICKNLATEIFMPDPDPNPSYKTTFGLSDEEFEIIKMIKNEENHFLFKHSGDSVIASIDLTTSVEILKILSADEITRLAMDEIILAGNDVLNSDKPVTDWLPQLFETLRLIEDKKIAEERQKLRLEALQKRERLKKILQD